MQAIYLSSEGTLHPQDGTRVGARLKNVRLVGSSRAVKFGKLPKVKTYCEDNTIIKSRNSSWQNQ